MSRVALSKLKTLTFHSDRDTLSRRGSPVPQLTCVGRPCALYQPQAVRCTNSGGSGADVEWTCEADLPDSLRFGKVQVSCEGWNGPGDTYVMKGSCGLEYTLVQIPSSLRGGADSDDPAYPARLSRWLHDLREDPTALVFMLLWVAVCALLLYNFLKSCCASRRPARTPPGAPPPPRRPGSGWFTGGGGGGGAPGGYPSADPPPPYSKHAPSSTSTPGARDAGGWRPGFWTGAALGWLGTQWMNRAGQGQRQRQGMYDWEGETQRTFRPARTAPPPASASPAASPWWSGGSGSGSGARRRAFGSDDRGEGSSNLGSMRRSTAFGGSSVR